jgi:hypothetical protein
MRLTLLFLLLLNVPADCVDAALVIFPLICLCAGMGVGIMLGREGMAFQFRTHMDQHFTAAAPVADCRFCKMERGLKA